ncbi:rhodanese-like domain-containing protein [Chloroflexota bacterium]
MKKQKLLLLLIIPLLLTPIAVLSNGCTEKAELQNQSITDVTAKEAISIIQENKNNPDFIIVDVRTPEEYAEGHIDNAVNIDFNSGVFNDETSKLDRYKTYLIYCRSGNRSSRAVDVMRRLDFAKIYHFHEGIIGWNNVGYPVTK